MFNISGQPAITLPLARCETGLPIGVPLVVGYGREDLLFRIVAELEQAMLWRQRTPACDEHAGLRDTPMFRRDGRSLRRGPPAERRR